MGRKSPRTFNEVNEKENLHPNLSFQIFNICWNFFYPFRVYITSDNCVIPNNSINIIKVLKPLQLLIPKTNRRLLADVATSNYTIFTTIRLSFANAPEFCKQYSNTLISSRTPKTRLKDQRIPLSCGAQSVALWASVYSLIISQPSLSRNFLLMPVEGHCYLHNRKHPPLA